jgi:hypothetical protein
MPKDFQRFQPGRTKTGGRQLGTLNLATREIKELAQRHAPGAVNELVRLAHKAKSEQARIAAIKEILDRAYGKATEPLRHSGEMALTHEQALDGLERRFPRFIDGKQCLKSAIVGMSPSAHRTRH